MDTLCPGGIDPYTPNGDIPPGAMVHVFVGVCGIQVYSGPTDIMDSGSYLYMSEDIHIC
jgi:hypothetical protein